MDVVLDQSVPNINNFTSGPRFWHRPLNSIRIVKNGVYLPYKNNVWLNVTQITDDRFRLALDMRQFHPRNIWVMIVNGDLYIKAKHKQCLTIDGDDNWVNHIMIRKIRLPKDIDRKLLKVKLTFDCFMVITAPKLTNKSQSVVKTECIKSLEKNIKPVIENTRAKVKYTAKPFKRKQKFLTRKRKSTKSKKKTSKNNQKSFKRKFKKIKKKHINIISKY